MDNLDLVLDKAGQGACRVLGKSSLMKSYYLAGGTGLALQLGHRRSLDLDFFQRGISQQISFNSVTREIQSLFRTSEIKLILKQGDQATWHINGTKVTFLAYPFPLLYPLVEGTSVSSRLAGIVMASPREIAAMKAYALGRRATFRDYIDLNFLLHANLINLKEVIRDARQKFILEGSSLFSTKLFLEQLSYTADIEDKEAAVNLVNKSITPLEVEEFLREQVRSYVEYELGYKEEILHETP